jgi:hypothetical protein
MSDEQRTEDEAEVEGPQAQELGERGRRTRLGARGRFRRLTATRRTNCGATH